MDNAITNGVIDEDERPGWTLECPHCGRGVLYTVLEVHGGLEPFLHCDRCSNFVLRPEDAEEVWRIARGGDPPLDALRALYERLARDLPPCPCGGRFSLWANARCPHCGEEFPYAGGERREEIRFRESEILWVAGAVVFRGATQPSKRLARVRLS